MPIRQPFSPLRLRGQVTAEDINRIQDALRGAFGDVVQDVFRVNRELNISVVEASGLVLVSAADTTPGHLSAKLPTGGDLVWTIVNPAANESMTAVLRPSAGVSVLGRAPAAPGAVADITASVDGDVLRVAAGVLGFGTIPVSSVVGAVATTRTLTAGAGLTGGGDLSVNRTFDVVAADGTIVVAADSIRVGLVPVAQVTGAVPDTRQIIAGAGLTGGGTLAVDRTLDIVAADATITVNANSIQVGTLTATQVPALNATFITQTPNANLANEQALSLLATGILKSTTGTGVVSIAVAGTDYQTPLTFGTGLTLLAGTVTANLSTGINAANQNVIGSTQVGGDLTLLSNNNTNDGRIFFGFSGSNYFDESVSSLRITGLVTFDSLAAAGVVHAAAGTGLLSATSIGSGLIPYGNGSGGLKTDADFGTAADTELFLAGGWWQTFYNVAGVGLEWCRFEWASNIFTIATAASGGGTVRNIRIQGSTLQLFPTTQVWLAASSGAGASILLDPNQINLRPNATIASAAAATLDAVTVSAGGTILVTGTTNITTAGGFNYVSVPTPFYNGGGSGKTITNAATLYLANAPQGSAGVTITNAYALWIDVGIARFDGNGTHVFELPADGTVAGAQTGRIPIRVGGATVYLHYYNG